MKIKIRRLVLLLFIVPCLQAVYSMSNQFHEFFKMIKLSENTEAGTPVYYIDQILPDTPRFPKATIFSKVPAFSYKSIDGSIVLTAGLDRESICPFNDIKCLLIVKVLLEPDDSTASRTGRGQTLLTLQIEIMDENDQAPHFTTDFSGATLNLCKTALINGMSGNIFLANDYDKVSHLRYGLKGAEFLNLDESSYMTSDGTNEAQLDLRLSPNAKDYDGSNQIVVQVSDGLHQMEQSVLIHIDPNCDASYRFHQKVYRATVEENVRSTATGIILESDGLYDQVTFTLIDPQAREYLKIDDETGEIHLIKSIDFEQKQTLRTIVELREMKSDAILDFAIVEILVRDVNDNPPQIQTTILPPSQLQDEKVMISESTPTGMALAYFGIDDNDLASAGQIDIRLNMGEEYFDLRNGFLILTKSLDRESQNLLQIGIYACDNGRPKACSTEEVTFVVSDDNDHVPMFTICPAAPVDISEDQTPGKLIALVRAADGDHLSGLISPFGEIEYFSLDAIVTVDKKSGRVFLNQALDREEEGSYSVAIIAQDGGTPPKKAKCELKLRVIDVNDNKPIFHDLPVITTISTTSPKNYIITKFHVTDADSGENSLFQLSLDNDYGLFNIDNEGVLTLSRNITENGESTQNQYNLRIIARDNGGLENTADVFVEIVLPEVLLKRSDPAVLSGALAGLALVFLILILIVIFKCCRNKKREIYKFRSAENTLAGCTVGDSKQTLSGWTVEINGTECSNVKTGLIVEPTGSDGTHTTDEYYPLGKSDSPSKKTRSREEGSDLVPDSGRGESEKDSITSGNCGLNGAMGPNCTKECIFQGHSDTCWMPVAPSTSTDSRMDHEIDTLSSSMIGYSKERFSRLSHQYINSQQKMSTHSNTLAPSSDQTSQRSSGYLSSNDGQVRNIHYC